MQKVTTKYSCYSVSSNGICLFRTCPQMQVVLYVLGARSKSDPIEQEKTQCRVSIRLRRQKKVRKVSEKGSRQPAADAREGL